MNRKKLLIPAALALVAVLAFWFRGWPWHPWHLREAVILGADVTGVHAEVMEQGGSPVFTLHSADGGKHSVTPLFSVDVLVDGIWLDTVYEPGGAPIYDGMTVTADRTHSFSVSLESLLDRCRALKYPAGQYRVRKYDAVWELEIR